VGAAGVDVEGAVLQNDRGRLGQGAAGVDDVVHDDHLFAQYLADEVHGLGLARGIPAFVDQSQGGGQAFGVGPGPGHPPGIGGDDGQVILEILPDIRDHDGGGVEVVHRDVEEALDLADVQVHGEDPVGPGGGQQIGHQLGGDGHPGMDLAVLAGIAEIGDDRGDAPGRSPFHRVDHDQQLHQVVVGGGTGGLDDEDVMAPDILADLYANLSVTEGGDQGFPQAYREMFANIAGQLGVGIAGEDTDVTVEHGGVHPRASWGLGS